MEKVSEILNFTQHKNSDECKMIRCNNSEAMQLNKCLVKTPVIECGFCRKELEQTGFYFENSPFLKGWKTRGEYERCTCRDSQLYWIKFDKDIVDEKEREEKEITERQYKQKLERMMLRSNLGERFKNRTFETYKVNFENKTAFEICKKYGEKFKEIKSKGIGLSITGNYGAGKTHLAAAIAHELIKQGYQPIFGTMISLLGKIKASYGDSKENEEQIINKYINCDLLIIDDLGKEKPTEWVLEKLYYIINCRYENNKPVVITSNYNDIKLMDRLSINDNLETSEAIVSRLYEMCQGVNMQNCKDYRKEV